MPTVLLWGNIGNKSPNELFSMCYYRKVNGNKLIGTSYVMTCVKELKTSQLFCLHNCGQFLHLCCIYLKLAKYVNLGCSLIAQGSTV